MISIYGIYTYLDLEWWNTQPVTPPFSPVFSTFGRIRPRITPCNSTPPPTPDSKRRVSQWSPIHSFNSKASVRCLEAVGDIRKGALLQTPRFPPKDPSQRFEIHCFIALNTWRRSWISSIRIHGFFSMQRISRLKSRGPIFDEMSIKSFSFEKPEWKKMEESKAFFL